MFSEGELLRIEGFDSEEWNGVEGTFLHKSDAGVSYIRITKRADCPYKVGQLVAMWDKNLVRVQRPEEFINEDWS